MKLEEILIGLTVTLVSTIGCSVIPPLNASEKNIPKEKAPELTELEKGQFCRKSTQEGLQRIPYDHNGRQGFHHIACYGKKVIFYTSELK